MLTDARADNYNVMNAPFSHKPEPVINISKPQAVSLPQNNTSSHIHPPAQMYSGEKKKGKMKLTRCT